MPRELKNLHVSWISLVDKGANRKSIIFKSDKFVSDKLLKTIDIKKTDEEKHLVYGIVYAPDEVDAHGDFSKAATIENAAHEFMKERNTQNVDKQHSLEKQPAYIAESWIVRKGDELFPEEIGAWAVAIKVEDEELWLAVKSGEIGGISLYGEAEVEPDENLFRKFVKWLRKDLDGAMEMEQKIGQLREFGWLMEKVINQILNSEDTTEEKRAQIEESVSQFKAKIDELNLTDLAKSGAVLSGANFKKLKDAIEILSAVISAANKEETKVDKKEIQEMIDAAIAKALEKTPPAGGGPAGATGDAIAKITTTIEELKNSLVETKNEFKTVKDDLAKSRGLDPGDDGTAVSKFGML